MSVTVPGPRRPREDALHKLKPVVTKRWMSPGAWKLDVYEQLDGYKALRKALKYSEGDLISFMKESGHRGRGGAGFPVGMKWQFVPDDGQDHYLVVNADEGEPGTCKDLPLMMNDPHSLIEGIVIASYAIKASRAYVYVRGEAIHAARRLRNAVREAKEAGYLGKDILGSGFDLEVVIHSGAGAYICGEETALLDSLEGKRGQPRLRPPFPATHGLYNKPTCINNVGSIAAVPHIVLGGAQWWKDLGSENAAGTMIYSLSGRVKRPGQYECSMGTTLRELIELAGGMEDGHELKFFTPGGSSTPMLAADSIDVPLDFDNVAKAGSILGTTAVMIFSDQDDPVVSCWRWIKFYAHESCGKCTPCREGNYWMVRVYERILSGKGSLGDLKLLESACKNLLGRSFCGLGDGATSCVTSSLKYFRQDYLDYIEGHKPPLFDAEKIGAH